MSCWYITIVERTDPDAVAGVRFILQTYHDELMATLGQTTLSGELPGLPLPYVQPSGALLLARDGDGRSVGCVAVKGLSATECEVKRLYVLPEARGSGLGRALVRAAADQARGMGYQEMLLVAVRHTTQSAQRIYREFGFEETPQFREAPLGHDPAAFLFMRRAL